MTDKDLSKSQVDKPAKADSFDLVFRGEIAPGSNIEEVKQRVAASFNLDSVAADQLFSGSAVRLKRGVDKITAERILQCLRDAGAIAIIVPNSRQPETVVKDPLSLAPLGSNVTDGTEKGKAKVVFSVSLDHLSLEPVGTRMVNEAEVSRVKTPDLDTSKFSLE
ncbi:MAG: hypothetical protein P8Q91_03260 [Porticoccaceae bacterium]|nr:hypothetical protein [Porticoccaceae bacterium]